MNFDPRLTNPITFHTVDPEAAKIEPGDVCILVRNNRWSTGNQLGKVIKLSEDQNIGRRGQSGERNFDYPYGKPDRQITTPFMPGLDVIPLRYLLKHSQLGFTTKISSEGSLDFTNHEGKPIPSQAAIRLLVEEHQRFLVSRSVVEEAKFGPVSIRIKQEGIVCPDLETVKQILLKFPSYKNTWQHELSKLQVEAQEMLSNFSLSSTDVTPEHNRIVEQLMERFSKDLEKGRSSEYEFHEGLERFCEFGNHSIEVNKDADGKIRLSISRTGKADAILESRIAKANNLELAVRSIEIEIPIVQQGQLSRVSLHGIAKNLGCSAQMLARMVTGQLENLPNQISYDFKPTVKKGEVSFKLVSSGLLPAGSDLHQYSPAPNETIAMNGSLYTAGGQGERAMLTLLFQSTSATFLSTKDQLRKVENMTLQIADSIATSARSTGVELDQSILLAQSFRFPQLLSSEISIKSLPLSNPLTKYPTIANVRYENGLTVLVSAGNENRVLLIGDDGKLQDIDLSLITNRSSGGRRDESPVFISVNPELSAIFHKEGRVTNVTYINREGRVLNNQQITDENVVYGFNQSNGHFVGMVQRMVTKDDFQAYRMSVLKIGDKGAEILSCPQVFHDGWMVENRIGNSKDAIFFGRPYGNDNGVYLIRFDADVGSFSHFELPVWSIHDSALIEDEVVALGHSIHSPKLILVQKDGTVSELDVPSEASISDAQLFVSQHGEVFVTYTDQFCGAANGVVCRLDRQTMSLQEVWRSYEHRISGSGYYETHMIAQSDNTLLVGLRGLDNPKVLSLAAIDIDTGNTSFVDQQGQIIDVLDTVGHPIVITIVSGNQMIARRYFEESLVPIPGIETRAEVINSGESTFIVGYNGAQSITVMKKESK